MNRSGPVIKEKIPAPFVCGLASSSWKPFFHELDHRNPFIVRNARSKTKRRGEEDGTNAAPTRLVHRSPRRRVWPLVRASLLGLHGNTGPRRKIYQPRPGHCKIVRRENLAFGFAFYGGSSTPRPPRRNLEIPCILVFFFSFRIGGFLKWISLRNRCCV